MRHMVFITCLLVSSCTLTKQTHIDTYGYIFHETTGITRAILLDGTETKIKFTTDSDKIALDTLTSLDWPVLYPSGDGKHIFVQGHLSNKVRWTPDLPNMAATEPFKEFRLTNWYIITPFKRINFVEEWLSESYKIDLSYNLNPSDFNKKEVLEDVTLSDYQRHQAP